MPWYYRRSSKLGPFRITQSKSGLSFSTGNRFFRRTVSTSGRRTSTFRLPGTGFFWRKSGRR